MTRADVVLGICDSHDAGVCLLRGGRVVAAVNEERLNRKKLTIGLPVLALQEIWEHVPISPGEVDLVALAGRVPLGPSNRNDFADEAGEYSASQVLAEALARRRLLRALIRSDLFVACYQVLLPRVLRVARERSRELGRLLSDLGVRAPLEIHEHHDCHLAGAFFTSGWERGLVLSNDGFGDGLCSKTAVFDKGGLRVVSQNSYYNSLGAYYAAVTHLCGFPLLQHTGKTTGLAAFGSPDGSEAFFREQIRWEDAQGRYVNHGPLLRDILRLIERRLAGVGREDLAAGMQRHLERVLARMAEFYVEKSGNRRVALTGGLHANVRANQAIAELADVEELAVFPHMGDGGLALGAAYLSWAWHRRGDEPPPALEDVYLGFAPAEGEILEALESARVEFERPADLASEVARELSVGRVVARFDGRMEYGPRALGNRSILCQATDPTINERLNRQLNRTEFMPFAPVIRERDAPTFFRDYGPRTAAAAQFMTLTYDVTERCRREAPAVVHVDGTARPQVLRRDVNPGYYEILDRYHELTGLSVLVNTSFNRHEEPIVCRPAEALSAFLESRLDRLAIGPFLAKNPDLEG